MTTQPTPDLEPTDPARKPGPATPLADAAPPPGSRVVTLLRTAMRGALGLLAVLALVFIAGELSGWRVLAGPAERWLTDRLGRPVLFGDPRDDGFHLTLWRGIRLRAAAVRVEGPTWAGAEPLFAAQQIELRARWRDLLRWQQGEPLPLRSLVADQLSARLVRRADGSANWQRGDGSQQPASAGGLQRLPVRLGLLSARDGTLHIVDAITRSDVTVQFSLHDAGGTADPPAPAGGRAAAPPSAPPSAQPSAQPSVPSSAPAPRPAGMDTDSHQGLHATATGTYQGLPVRGALRSGSLRPFTDGSDAALTLPMVATLTVGTARLDFDGVLTDPLQRRDLTGRIQVAGPSLAAVGRPLGITLPTTAPFTLQGRLAREGPVWSAVVQRARIGKSLLDGAFQYDTRRTPLPRLAGRLHARSLVLADLGPTIGTATPDQPAPVRAAGRVLPDRRFDLPSLRAMNANVLVQVDRLDFGTSDLQSIAPLNGHLTLDNGVLRLSAIDARLAQGRISGQIQLDGRGARAVWQAQLEGRGLRLEQWIRAVRRPGQPPYIGGLLGARLQLTGAGKSTADILGSADGRIGLRWTQGQISHLLVEAAGLDIAQGLGLLFKGDDPLAVSCGLADLQVHDGRVTPAAFVVDTTDSRLWLTGALSLATERLALVAQVQPKDFSPLTLRAPLHIGGTLGAPRVALDSTALARRAVPAALLALVHPLAGLIPLIDPGDPGPTQGCAALLAESRRQDAAPPPAAAASSR